MIDLVLPILVLIVCAILGMAYVGGFFEGVSFSEAIGYNPTAGLTLGAFAGLVTAFVLYIPRRLMTPKASHVGRVAARSAEQWRKPQFHRCVPSLPS